MAGRARSIAFPVLLLVAFAALVCPSPTWVAPSSAAFRSARAHTGAQSASLLVAGNAALLAGVPLPANAAGMFDFGLTLPFVAFTFILMMVVLNALWYSPVTTEMDERNEKLLQTLSEATDMLAKADEIQVGYTEKVRAAREKASKALSQFRETTTKSSEAQINSAKAASDVKISEARAKINADVEAKIASADSQIEARKAQFVKDTLAAVNL